MKTNVGGERLMDHDEMDKVWASQKQHIRCLQDLPGLALYQVVDHYKKGDVTVPVYSCARGSSSLEGFHYHLNHFIPGTSAGADHFQAFLLEGLHR